MQPQSDLLAFVPMLVLSIPLAVVGYLLAKEKGRKVVLWTILGAVPLINIPCTWFFIGAANLRLEQKLDELLSRVAVKV